MSQQLARRFGFVPGFDLAKHLAGAAERYRVNSGLQWSTPRERRRAADTTQLSLSAFLKTLPALDRCGGSFLVPQDVRDTLAALAADLQDLASRIPDTRGGGRLPDRAGHILVRDMHRAYRHGTGRTDKYTRDPDSGEYRGAFIEFAAAALQLMEIDLSPACIAETLRLSG